MSETSPSAPAGLGATAPIGVAGRRIADVVDLADAIIDVYAARGGRRYDEAVSQTAHAEQCAALARADDAPDSLVAAALLHDLGHLLPGEHERVSEPGALDLRHEQVAARFLASWFGPEVIEPVRLHVEAKRYLCAIEPGYRDALSPASVRSLGVQGGVMTADEVEAFVAAPGSAEAARLRRWDDAAKDPGVTPPPLTGYRDLLIELATVPAVPPERPGSAGRWS